MNSTHQVQANDAEWNNPANWSTYQVLGLDFGRIYRSRADTRLWVPKSNPRQGRTINLGHPRGPLLFWMIGGGLAGLALLVVLIVALALI